MKVSPSKVGSRPLGVVIIGRRRPGFDQEWNQIICTRSLAALHRLGFTCVGADAPVVDDASFAVVIEKIRHAQCEALLILQPSIGNGQLALTIAQKWANPVVVWATPERPGDGKVSSCSLVGQHLYASVLRQAGHPFDFVYGDPDDLAVHADLLRGIALARTVAALREARVGVIGTHAPGFIDLAADPFLLRRSLGVQMHPLSLPQFMDRVRTIPESTVREDAECVAAMKLPMEGVSSDDFAINSRCYLAMLALMEEESLDALTIQCWPEIPNMLGQWPYLAVSRLSTEGRAIAIEGDVDGCISSLIHLMLGLGPSFLTDWLEHDRSSIFFWHPGMAPMDMCNPIGTEGGPTLACHFNIDKPMVVNGSLRTGEPVTVTRLWHCDGRYHLTAFEGETAPPRRRVSGNSVLVEVDDADVPRRFDQLLHAGMPHHVLLGFGRYADTLRRLAGMLEVQWWQ